MARSSSTTRTRGTDGTLGEEHDVSPCPIRIETQGMSDFDQLVDGRHPDPHSILGAHPQNGGVVVRAFRPAAERVVVRPEKGDPVDAEQVHPAGVFEAKVPKADVPLRYELEVAYADGNT